MGNVTLPSFPVELPADGEPEKVFTAAQVQAWITTNLAPKFNHLQTLLATSEDNERHLLERFAALEKPGLSAPAEPMTRHEDNAEAAALQSWLVANVCHLRPLTKCGLMGWAHASLIHLHRRASLK